MSALNTDLRRREFLRGLSAAGIVGLAPLSWACRGGDTLQAALSEFFVDRSAAGIVGRVYLNDSPDERDPEKLVALIAGDSRAAWEALSNDREALYGELRRRHRADFALGKVTSLDGWLLSLTEARLCALAGLA